MVSHAETAVQHTVYPWYTDNGKRAGLRGFLTSTNHKRVGILYMSAILSFFTVAVILGVLMRIQMLSPDSKFLNGTSYNAMFTIHGIIMVFMVVIPGIPTIFGNFFMPILIGANDVSFPRLNLFSWYLYMLGAFVVLASLAFGTAPVDTGWTFYVPYSLKTTVNVPLAVFGVFLLGMSSMLTGINFVTTVHQHRAPGMTFFRMPLSVWGIYSTAWIQVLATPVIGITLVLIMVERLFGIGVFDASKGGDPILYQHLFWIYSHPAVYIMILPAMGIISDLFPVFSRKNIWGYKTIAFSSLAIASIGSLVWGHHMYVSGQSDTASWLFSILTFLVAVPSAIKVFNWVATMYKGSVKVDPPFLYALGFIALFAIGGLTGLVLGALSTDVHTHDTYFVVGHFHYVIFGGMGFGLFAAMHYWFPKMFGKTYNFKFATVAFIVLFVGFNVFYMTMLILGWAGMPRRYYSYLPKYTDLQVIATIGSWVMVSGLGMMFGNLIYAFFRGKKAEQNPWGGATLEWTLPSPPEFENWEHQPPTITQGPYIFNGNGKPTDGKSPADAASVEKAGAEKKGR
jgi:cytochrome c oxidase subunit 1